MGVSEATTNRNKIWTELIKVSNICWTLVGLGGTIYSFPDKFWHYLQSEKFLTLSVKAAFYPQFIQQTWFENTVSVDKQVEILSAV